MKYVREKGGEIDGVRHRYQSSAVGKDKLELYWASRLDGDVEELERRMKLKN